MVGGRALSRVRIWLMPLACLCLASTGLNGAGGAWTGQQELTASDGAMGDQFGGSVSLSGDTAVIGAADRNAYQGAAYVFVQSGGVWSQQQELIASDGAGSDAFGNSVSVSGDTALIGASGKNSGHGAAYVFVRTSGVWTQQQELTASDGAAGDNFGWSVSLSGNMALIGAPDKSSYQGAAYMFTLSGGVWRQQQKLRAPDGAVGDKFGYSVSVSGNTAIAGAVGKNSSEGTAYVFVQSGTAWAQQRELTASDGAAGDWFGGSVSVSGNTALIAARAKTINSQAQQGAAYLFMQSGGTWSQRQELTASDGAAGDSFGGSASLSGDTAAIGALGKSDYQGAVYVFVQSGGAWSQQQELTASDGAAYDEFGWSVSLNGGSVLVGAFDKAVNWRGFQGAAYVFAATPIATGIGMSGGGANIAQNAWISIYGSSLAPASVGTGLTWSAADFPFGQMPTQLQGVSVTVNGKPAYIYYVSATQVNVLTPLDPATGPVAVTVNNGTTTSAALTVNLQMASPGFLRFGDGIHIAALHANYSYLGPASLSVPGYTFTPATPGETILLFGDGFGLPVSTLTAGSDVQTGALPTPWPQITIGGTTATVQYAGLISPGLYQINVVVPSNAANGDNQVIATYGGASSPTGAMVPVSQ